RGGRGVQPLTGVAAVDDHRDRIAGVPERDDHFEAAPTGSRASPAATGTPTPATTGSRTSPRATLPPRMPRATAPRPASTGTRVTPDELGRSPSPRSPPEWSRGLALLLVLLLVLLLNLVRRRGLRLVRGVLDRVVH